MPKLILRDAKQDDALLLLRWQQEVETRRYARSRAIPSEEEHLSWFAKKLLDPNCVFLFAEADSACVGMVRLELRGSEWELSIIVAPEHRGRGVGKAMLDALESPGTLVAEVLPDNNASHRLFQSCGWRLCDDGRYRRRSEHLE